MKQASIYVYEHHGIRTRLMGQPPVEMRYTGQELEVTL